MEQRSLATDQEERELKRIGRQVARALEPSDGRAIAAARRKLFEPKEERRGNARWMFALGGLATAAVVVLALRTDPAPTSPSVAARAGGETTPNAKDSVIAADNARSHTNKRPDGASELVLERGEARGRIGEGSEVTSVVAGPYRVSGNARVVVTWNDEGLTLEVTEGEARVLAPGMTPAIVAGGESTRLPPTR